MIFMFKVKILKTKFINDLRRTKEQIKKNVASDSFEILDIIDKHTRPLVPLETGRLRQSVMRPNGMLVEKDFLSQEIEYSARNPRTGYDYALIQHETPPSIYHHRVGQWHYLSDGMAESEDEVIRLIEKDVDMAMAQTLKGDW